MTTMSQEKIQPFDSFTPVYHVLVRAGYYKLLNKPKNRFKWMCHQIYRVIAVFIIIGINLTHIIFIIQKRDDLKIVFDCSMIEIPQINLLIKTLTVNWNMDRIDKINVLLHDPIFAANTKKDVEMLSENKKNQHRLSLIINTSVMISSLFWLASHFVRRYMDPTADSPAYVPFKTDTWARYTCSVLLEVCPIYWMGYGHLALDCVVATYYAQAEVQLKIIKYNLEHLFDTDDATDGAYTSDRGCLYIDDVDKDLKNRFVHYVKRYETVVWYTKEIGNVFNVSMSFQFFTSTASLCVVTYEMVAADVTSVQLTFLVLLLVILLSQVCLYCYFGNMVQYESESVMTSVYLSDWLSASPQFRRNLLIAMSRWSRTLTPRVSGFIPLSLNTYVSVVRAAYSLYTVLNSTK